MSLEDKGKQHDGIVVDKYAAPVADYLMTTRDYVVRPRASFVTPAFTVYLPPVSEAKGRIYSIVARDADAIHTITVADLDDSECWPGDITLNGKCDSVLAYSDGLKWFVTAVTTYTGSTSPTTARPTSIAPTTAAGTGQATTLAPTTTG